MSEEQIRAITFRPHTTERSQNLRLLALYLEVSLNDVLIQGVDTLAACYADELAEFSVAYEAAQELVEQARRGAREADDEG